MAKSLSAWLFSAFPEADTLWQASLRQADTMERSLPFMPLNPSTCFFHRPYSQLFYFQAPEQPAKPFTTTYSNLGPHFFCAKWITRSLPKTHRCFSGLSLNGAVCSQGPFAVCSPHQANPAGNFFHSLSVVYKGP